MAKPKRTPKRENDKGEEKSWDIFARIDPSLRPRVEKYIQSREYPPHLARVIERAFLLLLEKEGF